MIDDLDNVCFKQKYNFILKCIAMSQASSEILCINIVLYKTLGIEKEIAIICMKELARRRILGEDFNYEFYIQEEIKNIPRIPDFNIKLLLNLVKI